MYDNVLCLYFAIFSCIFKIFAQQRFATAHEAGGYRAADMLPQNCIPLFLLRNFIIAAKNRKLPSGDEIDRKHIVV